MVDVPKELVWFVAGKLAAHRRAIGTRRGSRALSCYRQALFCLVWFRERREVALTGRGFGISQATAYRYLDESIEVLADRAAELTEALQRVATDGCSHVVLDGTVVATDRLASTKTSQKGQTIDTWNCGKTADFGGNIQAVMRPDGLATWTSDVTPGSRP